MELKLFFSEWMSFFSSSLQFQPVKTVNCIWKTSTPSQIDGLITSKKKIYIKAKTHFNFEANAARAHCNHHRYASIYINVCCWLFSLCHSSNAVDVKFNAVAINHQIDSCILKFRFLFLIWLWWPIDIVLTPICNHHNKTIFFDAVNYILQAWNSTVCTSGQWVRLLKGQSLSAPTRKLYLKSTFIDKRYDRFAPAIWNESKCGLAVLVSCI